jgi:hypothetical protein
MCVPLAGTLVQGGLLEQLGDPLGTRKAREDRAQQDQQNRWAREDQIRNATFAHEKEMAGMNRSSLNVPSPGTGKVGKATTQSGRNPGQY